MSDTPLSKNVGRFTRGKYVVTCASWKNHYGISYELGVRDTSIPHLEKQNFFLIQSDFFHAQNIQHYGAVAASMLEYGIEPKIVAAILNNADREDIDEAMKENP